MAYIQNASTIKSPYTPNANLRVEPSEICHIGYYLTDILTSD